MEITQINKNIKISKGKQKEIENQFIEFENIINLNVINRLYNVFYDDRKSIINYQFVLSESPQLITEKFKHTGKFKPTYNDLLENDVLYRIGRFTKNETEHYLLNLYKII